jgi:hypothetical protein
MLVVRAGKVVVLAFAVLLEDLASRWARGWLVAMKIRPPWGFAQAQELP